ncbi:hypothetical protein ACFC58_43325 [Kitasatospora purpeofusca]|uniref:hypothetical protein n=1 Tax=Kitasatospora purpeofusca TaxID=67352 RepID=UPI0035E1F6E1
MTTGYGGICGAASTAVARRAALAAAVGAALLGLVGCGGDAGGPKVAGAAAGDRAPGDQRQVMQKYASCLRDQGVQGVEVTDLGVGIPATGVGDGGAAGADLVTRASGHCDKQVPEYHQLAQRLRADQGKKDLDAARKFAACMRKNGLPDMPDPELDGGAVVIRTPAGPNWEVAMPKCGELMNRITGGYRTEVVK